MYVRNRKAKQVPILCGAPPKAVEVNGGERAVDLDPRISRTASLAEIKSFVKGLVGRLARDCWLIGDAVNVAEQYFDKESKEWMKRQMELCKPLAYSTIRKFAKLAADFAFEDIPSDMTLNAFASALAPRSERKNRAERASPGGQGTPAVDAGSDLGEVGTDDAGELLTEAPSPDPLAIARQTLPRCLAMLDDNLGEVLAGRKADRDKMWCELVGEERDRLAALATKCRDGLGRLKEELAAASKAPRQKARLVRIAPAMG